MRALWNIKSVRSNDKHEAQFPLELAVRVIRLYTDPFDLVLDPFVGSGTTAIAAETTNRKYIGIEKEKKYVDLSREKIKNDVPALLPWQAQKEPRRGTKTGLFKQIKMIQLNQNPPPLASKR